MLCLMLTSLFCTDPDLCCVLCWHQSFWLILNCVVFGVDVSIFLLILICVVFYVDIGIFDWSWTVLCFMLTSVFLIDLDLCCVWCWHHYLLIDLNLCSVRCWHNYFWLISFTSDRNGINVPGCLLGGIRRGWEQWQRNQWTLYAPPKWGCHNNNGCIII